MSTVAPLTRLAVCYRELVDAGKLAQRDRMSQIVPALEMVYPGTTMTPPVDNPATSHSNGSRVWRPLLR